MLNTVLIIEIAKGFNNLIKVQSEFLTSFWNWL